MGAILVQVVIFCRSLCCSQEAGWYCSPWMESIEVPNGCCKCCGDFDRHRKCRICHLKNSEDPQQHQKYKSRVVFRCDIVKDDSGSCAVLDATQLDVAERIVTLSMRLGGLAPAACWASWADAMPMLSRRPAGIDHPTSSTRWHEE